MTPRVTISMPCYGRPARTIRAINCILNQTVEDWEAFIIGDNCPDFESILRSGFLIDPRITAFNNSRQQGGCGYWATNYAIQHATGKYFLFFANDDLIAPIHMSLYLSQIEGTDLDFVYCDYIAFDKVMKTRMRYARIGHSALIVRTEFLKQMPPHSPQYGHDYELIKNMRKAGAKYLKAKGIPPTYYVMSGFRRRNDPEGID